jgi:hypothetical protein
MPTYENKQLAQTRCENIYTTQQADKMKGEKVAGKQRGDRKTKKEMTETMAR